METVLVDVKSAWLSKINWTQAIGVLATIAAIFGFNLPPAMQVQIVAVIQGAVAILTYLFKTFGRPSATPSQAKIA